MAIAASDALVRRVVPAARALHDTLSEKATEFADVVKIGRTHLEDATPLTLGQEMSGWASQLAHGITHVEQALRSLLSEGPRWAPG
jgi:fumarate hydratase class II